jgi:SAM-dependent methyltransferase
LINKTEHGYICPICGCKNSDVWGIIVPNEKNHARCRSCKHLFAIEYSQPIYSARGEEAFKENFGFQGITSLHDCEEYDQHVNDRAKKVYTHKKLNEIYHGQKNSVEIGCMNGVVLKRFQDAGCNVVGYEPNKYAASAYEFINPRGFDENHGLEPESIDLLYSFHVFEHLPDPVKSIGIAYNVLKVGGMFFMEIPFEDDDYYNEDHLHFFTVKSIKRLFGQFMQTKITIYSYVNINGIDCTSIQVSGVK